MTPLLLIALFWDGGPETADVLKKAGITRVLVAQPDAWKSVAGISVEAFDPAAAVKLAPPKVNMRVNVASATRSPWVDTNGARLMRDPSARFYYDAPGAAASLAAAEAFMYGAHAAVRTDPAGLEGLGRMLAFLGGLPPVKLGVLANIGYIDDGSGESRELMLLMVRRNLLFKVVQQPDPKLDLTVRFGSKEYPKSEAANPSAMAAKVRSALTDDKRLVRVYGSDVVIARLEGDGSRARLHLLNYAGSSRAVSGIRVRVLGQYAKHTAAVFDGADVKLVDYTVDGAATEFTLPELRSYAVIDLSR